MIEGVEVKKLEVIPDERGRLFEIIRRDEDIFERFGQVYLTTTYPGIVKAWHLHKKQTDYVCPISGMIKLALYDSRPDSPTYEEIVEITFGEYKPLLVKIPPNIYHGWKCVSESEALVINCPTEPYDPEDPDEFRLPPDTEKIPYQWHLFPGKEHG